MSSSARAPAALAGQPPRTDIAVLAGVATWALAAAALAELLLLRLLSRTAVHVPADQPLLRRAYEGVLRLGNLALDAAQVLLVLAVVLVLAASWHRREARYAALMFALFGLTAAALRLGWLANPLGGAASAGLITAAGAPAAVRWRSPSLALYLAAFDLLAAHTILQGAGVELGRVGQWVLWSGDLLAIAAGVVLVPRAVGARRRGVLLGLAAGGVTAAMLYGPSGWTLRFLTLWNFGLAESLPGVLYAGAVGVAAAAASRAPVRLWPPLMLLLAGGLGLHNTYQTGLALAGLLFLLLAAHPAGPARR